MSSVTMTSAYNKKGKNATRIGNWVEELALKDQTGHDRYENWTDEPGKRHARGGGKPGSKFNGNRIVAHQDCQDPKDYKSIASFDDPKDNQEFKIESNVGPRERRRLQLLEAQAKEIVDAPKEQRPMPMSTTSRDTFVKPSEDIVQQRVKPVPRGRGGDASKTVHRTYDGKSFSEVEAEAKENMPRGDYMSQVPVTLYSQNLTKFNLSAANGANPFARSTTFTNDISDSTKRHAEGADGNGMGAGGLGVTANEFSAFDTVKNTILKRSGTGGTRAITRVLRLMDDNGNKKLDKDEFVGGLQTFGIDEKIAKTVFPVFDRDNSGSVDIGEFLRTIRGPMNQRRKDLVMMAYDMLDVTGDGLVTFEDIKQAYDVSCQPEVLQGIITEQEALEKFMEQWEVGVADGIVTVEEFLEYYNDLSCNIEDDDYFELMIRNAWHMSGGDGVCGNTTCRRVLVTHTDGSQEVVEIKNDLGIKASDTDLMIKRLTAQGVKDIKEISLAD